MKNNLLSNILNNKYDLKEVDLNNLNNIPTSNIKVLLLTEKELNKRLMIQQLLLELGIPSYLKGYTCLTEAIFLCLNNDDYLKNITIKLYPVVGKELGISKTCVEKNIRKAIDVGCTNTSPEILEEIFGYSISVDKGKPTNSNYIFTIYNLLR